MWLEGYVNNKGSEAGKFYDRKAEKEINCNTLFQSKFSVNVLQVEIYILKQLCNMLQEMQSVTKSHWG